MNQDYADVLTQPSQQSQERLSIGNQPSREQVKAKLANAIGTTSEAAAATGVQEQQAHEIVSRAFRNAW